MIKLKHGTLNRKYAKIFKQEAKLGYTNHAVWGGIPKLAEAWPSDAREAALPEELIAEVTAKLKTYSELDARQRRQSLIEIGQLLGISEMEKLPPVPMEPEIIPQAEPAAKEAPHESALYESAHRRSARSEHASSSSNIGLDAPVSVIRGIGEKQAANLEN